MALLGQFRRDTLENWSTINPMLADGEFIIVRDNTNTYTIGYKTGNGYSRFNDLGYNSNVTFLNELGDNEQAGISQKFTGQIINDYNISNLHTNEIAADPAFGTNKFTLSQAIAVIPASVLKQGLVITFISSETNEWKRYQNVGTPFTTLQNWEDLASSVNVIQPPGDLDVNDYLYNIYYAPITGKVTYEPSRLTTDFIQVDNGQIIDYTIYGYTSSIAIAAFDANQNIILNKCVITSSLTGETGRYIVDSDNIRFLRFTRLNNVTGLNQAVSFYKPDYLPNIEESTKGIRQFSESDFIVEGMYINPVTGKDVANASWNATDFIPVVGGELIFNKNLYGTTGGAVIAFYDGAKVPVELIRGNTAYDANFVSVPEGALYVRFSMATGMPITIKIINGTNRTQMLSEDKGEIIVDGFDKFYVTGTWSRSGKDLTVTGGSFTQARYDTPTFEDEFVMSCRVRSTVATGGGFETGIGKTSPTAGYVDRWIMMCKDSTGSYLKSYYRPNGSFAEQTGVRQKLATELVLNKWYVLQLIKTTDEKSAITGRLYDEETGELLASFRTTAAPYAWGYPVAINRTGQAQFSGFVMSYPKKSYPLVAVYGDSFIEGNSIEATKNLRYSALLQSVLGKYQCLLFGHGGATSLSDDSRTLLQIEKVNSAYAIIAYGDNDVDFNTWYKYVAYMIQMCELTNTLPVFVTVCPRVSQSAAYVTKMQAINNWIRTSGYPYIDANEACTSDGLTWKTGYVLDDGQHPSVLGHQAIFNKIKSDCGFLVENVEAYTSILQELGDNETVGISQRAISLSQSTQMFNGNSVIDINEINISQCIKHFSLEDFDTENNSEPWKLLSFGFLTSSSIVVFYLQRVSDGKMAEYEPEVLGDRTGVQYYDSYVNNLHIKLYFDWSIYNELFVERYIPSGENQLLINAIKGTSTEITKKGFYTTNGTTIRNDNVQISKCFSNFKLYEYQYTGGSYEFYQQGWLPSVGHPIFYYKKIGTDNIILFDDTTITIKPTGVRHHLYDNGAIRVEFDFDWDLFFLYFPTDCYRRRENNFLTVNSTDFRYAYKIDSVVKSIDQLSIKQDKEYAAVTEFFRNEYVIYNSPVPKTSLLKTLIISVSRSNWTTTPELVKLNLIIGTFDQRNTLVNPRTFTYSLSELSIKYPSSLYVEVDLSDKNIGIEENEVIGVRSGSTATNDFIFLVSRGTDLSDNVFIATGIDDTFQSSYQMVRFEATFSVIDSIFSTKESVEKLDEDLTTLSNSLAPTIANILTDDATGIKYKLRVTNGILNVKSLNYSRLLTIGTSQVNPQAEPSYGWFVNRTMAASVYGHALADYILRGVQKRTPEAVMSLMNDYLWQRNYDNFDYSQYDTTITEANPDAIYLVTGGNSTYSSTFGKSFGEYLDYLRRIAPNAEIYVLVGWYGATKANDMAAECIKRNISYVNISYNRNKYNTWTVGDYYLGDSADVYYPITNTAVGSHPNDMGHFQNAEELLSISYQSSNNDLQHDISIISTIDAEIVNNKWIEGGIMTIRIKSGTVTTISVKDADGGNVVVTERTNNNNSDYDTYYTFVMPNKDVIIIIN